VKKKKCRAFNEMEKKPGTGKLFISWENNLPVPGL
jgi:hypothetical protein